MLEVVLALCFIGLVIFFLLYAADARRVNSESYKNISELQYELEVYKKSHPTEVVELTVDLDNETTNKLNEMSQASGISIDHIVQAALTNKILRDKGFDL